jgi:hypothetical protein
MVLAGGLKDRGRPLELDPVVLSDPDQIVPPVPVWTRAVHETFALLPLPVLPSYTMTRIWLIALTCGATEQ